MYNIFSDLCNLRRVKLLSHCHSPSFRGIFHPVDIKTLAFVMLKIYRWNWMAHQMGHINDFFSNINLFFLHSLRRNARFFRHCHILSIKRNTGFRLPLKLPSPNAGYIVAAPLSASSAIGNSWEFSFAPICQEQ